MDGQIQRYKAYLTVAHSLSFTEAAQALGYSQSAVSRLVAELEREWDVQLFERSRAGVRLTNVGQQLLPAAKAICQAESEFRTQVENIHNLSAGTIRIGTISSIATHWLPRIVAAFQADYPGINYELFLGDYTQLAEALDNGRIDCAFTRLPVEGAFNALPLEQDELMGYPARNPSVGSRGLPFPGAAGAGSVYSAEARRQRRSGRGIRSVQTKAASAFHHLGRLRRDEHGGSRAGRERAAEPYPHARPLSHRGGAPEPAFLPHARVRHPENRRSAFGRPTLYALSGQT